MEESRLYAPPLRHGKRCVLLCEGFYEWKKSGSKDKRPHLIFRHQTDVDFKERDWQMKTEKEELDLWWDEKNQSWKGPQLLAIAGLYDVQGTNGLYSFTVLTVPASKSMSGIHSRMPAILETDEDVSAWLNFKKVPFIAAVKLLKSSSSLEYYEVDKVVGNSRNECVECVLPFKESKPTLKSPNRGMKNLHHYFKRSQPSSSKTDAQVEGKEEPHDEPKIKIEKK